MEIMFLCGEEQGTGLRDNEQSITADVIIPESTGD